MTPQEAFALVHRELRHAEVKFPWWPSDPIHAAAIVVEEAGELQQAALNITYDDGLFYDLQKEAVQTAAMAIRLLVQIAELEPRPSPETMRRDDIAELPPTAGRE